MMKSPGRDTLKSNNLCHELPVVQYSRVKGPFLEKKKNQKKKCLQESDSMMSRGIKLKIQILSSPKDICNFEKKFPPPIRHAWEDQASAPPPPRIHWLTNVAHLSDDL